MNMALKWGLLAASVGMVFSASPAAAAIATHSFSSHVANYCQQFNPDFTFQRFAIRSDGIQNRTSVPVAVGCNFHSMNNGGAGNTAPTELVMRFSTATVLAVVSVTCTLLTGHQTETGTSVYAVSKNTGLFGVGMGFNGPSRGTLIWNASDNPNPGATTLGSRLIGVTCALPTNGAMNEVYVYWMQDNGI